MQRLGDILKGLFKELPEPMSREEYIKWQAKSLNEDIGSLNEIDGYNCEKCRNKGLIFYYNEGQMSPVSRECECRVVRRSLREMRDSGMSREQMKKTLSSFEVQSNWQRVLKQGAQAYLEASTEAWFFVGGQSGAGKTHLCTAICMELLKRGKSLIFMPWQNAIRELKSLANDVEYCRKISKYVEVDVLYIDDLFKVMQGEKPSPADIKIAYEILNARLVSGRATIISSEHTIAELGEIEEATISRINEKAKPYVFNIERDRAKNYRMK